MLLHSGRARRPPLRQVAKKVMKARGITIVTNEVALSLARFRTQKRGPRVASLVQAVRSGAHDLVLAIPPASTFSRARLKRSGGPPLARSKDEAYGIRGLRAGHPESIRGETACLQCLCKLLRAQADAGMWFVLAGAEDLGRGRDGRWPATIWDLVEVQQLVADCAPVIGAVALGSFGASSLAPCRIASKMPGMERLLHPGPPILDMAGRYVGPLRLDDDSRGAEDP